MVELKEVSFRYENGENGTLSNLSLSIPRGQCLLLCGESGCGKTTLTRLLNGLIPHYYEGTLTGQVLVDGVEVSQTELFETARHVGSVFQNPRSQFFCVDTTSELAFGCENLGLPEAVIRTRIARAAKEFRMEALLGRSIFNLSGGEKQKVACAGISAMEPELFVLDEPTS
ncbi:ABC transporter ATP-binding protein, partial [Bacteroides thetaiotaomicron]